MELSCSFAFGWRFSFKFAHIFRSHEFQFSVVHNKRQKLYYEIVQFLLARSMTSHTIHFAVSFFNIFAYIFISLKIIFVQTTMFCAFDKRQYWILQANVSKLTILNVLGCWKSLLSIRYYCFLCIRANIKNGKNQKCSAVLVIVVVVVVVFVVVVVDAIHIDCCFNSSLSCVCLLFSFSLSLLLWFRYLVSLRLNLPWLPRADLSCDFLNCMC